MAEKYKVIDSIWFDKTGIVKVETQWYGNKYYIGEGLGIDQEEDEQKVARNGMPVNKSIIKQFFKED